MLTVLFLFISGYGCAGAAGAMSGGGENAQFGATAAMVAAATSAAMQDSQPFSQVKKKSNIQTIISTIMSKHKQATRI